MTVELGGGSGDRPFSARRLCAPYPALAPKINPTIRSRLSRKRKIKSLMTDDDKPVVEVAGDKLPVEVDVTVKGVRVRVLVTLQKRNDPPATRDAERL